MNRKELFAALASEEEFEYRQNPEDPWFRTNPMYGWEMSGLVKAAEGGRLRVKPKPREFWVNEYTNGLFGRVFTSEIEAARQSNGQSIKLCHLREVLD